MSRLVPYLVTLEPKRIARFVGGLAPEIKASVKASRPTTFSSVVDLSLSLTLDAVRQRSLKSSDEGKRKREDENSRRSDKKHKGNSDHKKGSGFETKSQSQSQPRACGIYESKEHKTLDCKKMKDTTCYNCNEKGHIKTNCPKYAKKPEGRKL
ncbi:uncharacterized protein LOC110896038 [Helianthus annuus]|uniref:uncharacterized protein LOC110896038 n=1 Tax=Helianthus annuus TaxID=4232 RepID=UPI001652F359|nr:uncharacterized protein LOC110896038 [Helianthus annuus]